MFPSIVGTQRYGIVTVTALGTRPAMPTLATPGMIGQTADSWMRAGIRRAGLPARRTDDVDQSACAVGAIVSLAESAARSRAKNRATLCS
jgi:hypothetical protein